MPKRKRNAELGLHAKLEKHQDDIARALKTAKGFERQRLSKRLRDDDLTSDKQERLEREIAVLKVRTRVRPWKDGIVADVILVPRSPSDGARASLLVTAQGEGHCDIDRPPRGNPSGCTEA